MRYEFIEEPTQQLTSPESAPQALLRNIARTGARGVEAAVGLPGDIGKGLLGLANLGIEKATGKPSPLPQEIPLLPTSESLKTSLTKPLEERFLPKGYLQPQGEKEELADTITSDLASLLIPVPGAGKIPFKRSLAAAGLGNLAPYLAKQIGYGEEAQTGIKMGTMLATTMLGPTKLKNYMSNLYNKAESLIPQGATVSAAKIEPTLDRLRKVVSKGDLTPSKQFLKDRVESVERLIKDGNISVEDAWSLKKDLNEWFSGQSPKGAEKLASPLIYDINSTLELYGKKNPEFIKSLRSADDVYRGINKAGYINKFLQENINRKNIGYATASMLLGGHPIQTTGKAILGGIALRGLVQGSAALKNSAEIRKYYARIISAAARKNAPLMGKYVEKLDSALSKVVPESKQQESGRYEFLE